MLRVNRLAIPALLIASLASHSAFAQSTGRLTGTVRDGSAAVVAGVEVNATNQATGVAIHSVTNESGIYSFPTLTPGLYRISTAKAGFKSVTQEGVLIETGFARGLDITLEVGQVVDKIVVSATPPLIDSETSDVGQLVDRNKMMAFPLRDRRANQLILLAPTVVSSEPTGTFVTMGGGQSRNNAFLLDGINNVSTSVDLSEATFNPPAESIQEFKVEVNNLTADLGRTSGGVVSAVTRSGTNDFHGAGYWFGRRDGLDSRSFFAPFKEKLNYNVYGGSLGGPVKKNKAFFFVNYEYQKTDAGTTFSGYVMPHPADRTGDFSRRVDVNVNDPLNGQRFPNNTIPASRIDPVAANLVKYFAMPNSSNNDVTRAPRANYTAIGNNTTTPKQWVAKFDYNVNDRNRFFIRYNRLDNLQTPAVSFPKEIAAAEPGTARFVEQTYQQWAASWTSNIRSNWLNELRYGYIDGLQFVRSIGAFSNVAGTAGLKGVDPAHFPQLSVPGLTTLGDFRNFWAYGRNVTSIADTVTWIRGKHQLRFGGDFFAGRVDISDTNGTLSGIVGFSNRVTNEGLAAFLLGQATSGSTNSVNFPSRGNFYSMFVTDDFKAAKNLTLNIGLRYEVDQPTVRPEGQFSGFDVNAINPVSNTRGAVAYAPFANGTNSPYVTDRNNFGPHFGFAWRPASTWVVRGGYSILYDKPFRHTAGPAAIGFSGQRTYSSPDGGITPAFLLKDGFPAPVVEARGPGFGAVPVGSAVRFSPDFFNPVQHSPYRQQWNLSVQRQVFGDGLVELGYLANVGHKLYTSENINLNVIPLVNGRGPAVQSQLARPFPQYANVSIVFPAWGNSTYHAMIARFQKRYSNGLSVITHYTWSKALDDLVQDSTIGGAAGTRHIELRRLDKSYSPSHIGQRFVLASVYDLPFGKGRRHAIQNAVLDGVLGGWTLAPNLEWRSGAVWVPGVLTNRFNTFGGNRPNAIADPILSGDRALKDKLAKWFNTAAFVDPAVSEAGNAAKSYCCGPGAFILDFSVQKNFRITERYVAQFRGDFFNLPNHPVFGLPAGTLGAGNFGQIAGVSGATTPRQVQLGLRFQF